MIKLIKFINNLITNIKSEISEGKYNRSKSKIDNYKTNNSILIEEANNLDIKKQNKKIKDEINRDKRFIRSGKVYSVMAFICFISNLGLSIGGVYKVTNEIIFVSIYIITMSVLESSIYISAKYNSDDYNYFNGVHKYLKLIRSGLMITSISLNILFFHELFNSYLIDLIMSPICISLGFLTLIYSTLGYDKKYLIYDLKDSVKNKSTLEMFLNNLTFSLRCRIRDNYNKNNNVQSCPKVENNLPIKSIDISKDVLMLSNDVQSCPKVDQIITKVVPKLSKDIERFLELNYKNKILTSEDLQDIFKKFDLTDFKWRKIKLEISNIKIIGKRTKVI